MSSPTWPPPPRAARVSGECEPACQTVAAWLAGERELAPITELLGVRPVSLGNGEATVELVAGSRLHNAMGTGARRCPR